MNSVFTKKLTRLKDLSDVYNTLLRYYPETLFLNDLNDKMDQVQGEIKQLETLNTTTITK